MPIFQLDESLSFPNPLLAHRKTGILAMGGDLSPERLLLAYSNGIFPWYDESVNPILWHSPEERMLLLPEELHLSRSLKKFMRKRPFEVRYDQAFESVIHHCAQVPRPGQEGTWLNQDMVEAYIRLYRMGHAHSASAWLDGRLVGGLYGVALGCAFSGESMFSLVEGASKVIFATAVPALQALGYRLIDCQIYTHHLARFGARERSRRLFLRLLKQAQRKQPLRLWPTCPSSENCA